MMILSYVSILGSKQCNNAFKGFQLFDTMVKIFSFALIFLLFCFFGFCVNCSKIQQWYLLDRDIVKMGRSPHVMTVCYRIGKNMIKQNPYYDKINVCILCPVSIIQWWSRQNINILLNTIQYNKQIKFVLGVRSACKKGLL